MKDSGIWSQFEFTDKTQTSAYEILLNQANDLVVATSGELKMDVEAIDVVMDINPPKPAALYILYVVAPNLGEFRRKILSVAEYDERGRFPVDIVSHLDNSEIIREVSENKFLATIKEILSRPIVKKSIENLYIESKNYRKNKNLF
jgi:hypothetical protein